MTTLQVIFFVIYQSQDKSLLFVKEVKVDMVMLSLNLVLIEFPHCTKEETRGKRKL
jgi:hypothetical protein